MTKETLEKKSRISPSKNDLAEVTKKFLTFLMGKETYAIEVQKVREIIDYDLVFKVPRVPACIRGVINLRGEVVPVIDLGIKFFNTPAEETVHTSIIILEIPNTRRDGIILIGAVADKIMSVLDIVNNNIEQTPKIGAKIPEECISGIIKTDSELIIHLNIDTALDIKEISALKN